MKFYEKVGLIFVKNGDDKLLIPDFLEDEYFKDWK